jgi:Flp pilus assembly secretin CpaC
MREAGIIVPYQVTLFPVSVNTLDNVGELSNIGIQFPPATANLSSNESRATSLSRATLRASHNKPATFRLGTRYPVITAAQTLGTAPVTGSPLITYEDLGISIQATPAIHKNNVTLELEMDIESLGSEVLNGIPTIASRKYKGSITVGNDEPAMVAGSLSRSEVKSLQSIPGIGYLPLLGPLTSNHNKEEDTDEVLVVVTPHIVSGAAAQGGVEIFLP